LVNVSGFHVDPGFRGRLKFWVYNAGNNDIQVLQGDPLFLIWFSDLDRPTRDPYPRNSQASNEITAEDLRRLQGRLASPAALAKQIAELQGTLKHVEWILTTVVVILVGLCLALATPLLDNIVKPAIERFSTTWRHPPVVAPAPVAHETPKDIQRPTVTPAQPPSSQVPSK
jgi:dCTP deaminase